MKKIVTLFYTTLLAVTALAQTPSKENLKKYRKVPNGTVITIPQGDFKVIDGSKSRISESQALLKSPSALNRFTIIKDTSDVVIFIENNSKITTSTGARKSVQVMGADFLEEVKTALKIEKPAQELEMVDMQTDEQGQTHIKVQQKYKNIPVYGGELILHTKGEKIDLLNGRSFPTPTLTSIVPSISAEKATALALKDVSATSIVKESDLANKVLGIDAEPVELIIYHKQLKTDNEKLAYKTIIHPNVLERWVYFIDANTGEVLEKYNHTCSLDGPKTASARDLNGVTQAIKTYQSGSRYFMIDNRIGNSSSINPENPVGAIWTIDGLNSRSSDENANFDQVSSGNNSDWSPTAVSAQYNGSVAYEYYKTVHNRNALNGKGGTIVSVINIADEDGKGMDNAYWNGQFMAYGNGGTAFKSLAGALDVAGHEMTHGVVDATAKLEYLSQSGAINESFADIFAAMIDRNNWTIGEQVVKANAYPSGALRSLQNPNQGGKSDPGYQPATMTQYLYLRETEEQDNGGVHINSGIPNFAFYKFATVVGKDKAEKVYYQALTKYLTRNSQFVDLRLAVVQSAKDIYPTDATIQNAAKTAFDAVGILDPNGSTTTTPTTTTIPTNAGTDYILVYEDNETSPSLYQIKVGGTSQIISKKGTYSKPSVQDDGQYAYFVGWDSAIYRISLTSPFTETKMPFTGSWYNVAVSKDGKRLAATRAKDVGNNYIRGDKVFYIFDLATGKSATFTAYNPTTTSSNIKSSDVLGADSFEWDYLGEKLVYDSESLIKGSSTNAQYWDLGFIKVWDAVKNDFSTGQVQKLFTNLEEGESIVNPSFSKNSPTIIAFDDTFGLETDTESDDKFYIYGVDLSKSTYDANYTWILENDVMGYPTYSRLDNQLLFNTLDAKQTGTTIGKIGVATNKISASGSASYLFDQATTNKQWAVWYSQGTRTLPTKTTQSITFGAITDKNINEQFTANATASSKLAVQYAIVSGDATVSGNTITAGTTAGKVKMQAYQLGNDQYTSATAEQTFCVIPAKPTLTANGTQLTVSGGNLYQFYLNGQAAGSPLANTVVKVEDSGVWTVKSITSDGCYSVASNAVTVTLNTILGINTAEDFSIKTYPNPSSDEIKVDLAAGIVLKEVKVTSETGKELVTTKENIIKINQLISGIYFLTIDTNKGVFVKKIVKK